MTNFMKGDIYIDKDYKNYIHETDGGNQTVYGTNKNETFLIATADNTLYAGGGDDKISLGAFSWNDVVYAEAGDDFIGTSMNSKNPTIYGGKGNDTIRVNGSVKAYADGGEGDDLFIPLENAKVTLTGGEGNDTFWFIESSSATITGGAGNNLYYFDPYYLFGPYRNDVVITDISSNDTIRFSEEDSDTTELSWSKDAKGNIVLTDESFRNIHITLQGVTELSQVANVVYRSVNETKTLGEIFGVSSNDTGKVGGDTLTKENPPGEEIELINKTNNTLITGSASDDTITNLGESVTINTGTGNDSIANLGANVTFVFSGGKDTISGFNETSTLKMANSNVCYSSVKSGNNIIIGDGNDSITLVNAANLTALNVDGMVTGGAGGDTLTKENPPGDGWEYNNSKATYTIDGKVILTVSGVKSLNGLSLSGKIVTVSNSAIGTENISISGTGYKFALGNDVSTPQTTGGGWKLNGSTATYETGGTTSGYELSADSKTINFVEASDGDTLTTVSGMKSVSGLSLNGKTVTVSNSAIGTENISISGTGYKLALGNDVSTPQTTGGGWKLNGSKATYETGGTTAGYKLSDDAQTINFVEASNGDILTTVSGVKSLNGLSLSGKTVIVSKAAIGTENISISGTGYKLALGTNVSAPQTKSGGWKLNGSTATYETGGTTAGYKLSNDATEINFVEASDGDTLTTVSGMKSLKGLGSYGETIKIDPKYIVAKSKCATVSGEDHTFELKSSGKLSAGENTTLKGSSKADTLIANVTATLDGGKGADIYSYGGGNVTMIYSASDKDKISLGAGFEIVGVTEDADGIALTLSKTDSLGAEVDGDYSLILSGADSNTKINLVTTKYVRDKKGKIVTKATSSVAYFDDNTIRDGKSIGKIKKITLFGTDNTDFSGTDDNRNAASAYKALTTITATAENVNVTGNEKSNTIALQSGGTAQGGLGNDTFIIKSGNATIEDYGIGAKNTLSDNDVLVAKLATKVTSKKSATKKSKTIFSDGTKDTVAKGVITAYKYENEIGKYAEGSDVVKVGDTIQSITFDGLDGNKGDAVTDLDGQTFSVTITYGDGETVTLENIMREVKQVAGSAAKKKKSAVDTAVVFAKNASTDAQSLKIEYYDSATGKYVKVGKSSLLNWFNAGNRDAAVDDTANDLMSDDNFTGNDLSDLVTNDTASNAITTDNFALFDGDEFTFDNTTTTFTDSAK